MKYFSEKTKEMYETLEECEEAETRFDEVEAEREAKRQKAEEEKKARAAERAVRAKEVENALEEARNATNRYLEVLQEFLKDYGSFHYTVHGAPSLSSLVNDLMKGF